MTMTGVEVVAKTALGGLSYVNANWSDTINIATTGAGGMDTGTAPVSGYVAIYRIYNPTTTTWKLLGYNATSAVAPEVYGGANMPVGYTASALVSVWPTNASSQFITGTQRDRTVTRGTVTVLSATTAVGTPTSLNISTAVPANASSLFGSLGGVPNSGQAAGAASVTIVVSPDSAQTGAQSLGSVAGGGNGANANVAISIYTSQTLYYTTSISTGTSNFTIAITGYSF
ncbi:MAG: phage tail protein [Ralstonia sp.]|nr:phage tail protein [Ralstonia sp.]